MIETDGPGGAELVVYRLSEELRRRGHRIVAVGPAEGEGWLSGLFERNGFERRVFRIRRALDLRCLRELTRTLREAGVDVVHSHEFTMAVYGAAAAGRLGLPHVITMHGNEAVADARRRRIALRWAFRRSVAAVGVSEHTRSDMQRRIQPAPGLLQVVPNGVPVRPGDGSRIRAELGIAEQECVVLAVGNLYPRKGHSVLLEALSRLGEPGGEPAWRLLVAGRGSEQGRLEALASEWGVGDRLHLLGLRDDVPDLLAAADVYAMPSYWEGLPLALLEAMLAGCAIIASDVGGIREAITPDEHGLLVPPGEVEALAGGLSRLLRDPELRARLGATARTRALQQFTLEVMTDRYEALYRGSAETATDVSSSASKERATSPA